MDTSQLYSSTSSGPAMGDPIQGSTSSNTGGGTTRRRRSREIETMSLEIRNYPRDLLQTFISTDPNATQQQKQQSAMEEQEKEDEDLELNLGLSLDGKFGVDKSHRGLIRSSSIAGAIPCFREGGEEAPSPAPKAAALARTSSLPTVTEEEWRRRKATLRRMEAKRRRSEKQRSVKESGGAGEERESGSVLSFRGRLEREQQHLGIPGKLNPGPGPGLPGQVKGKGGFFRSLQGLLAHQQQQQQQQQQLQGCSQGSLESQGGSSSGASELESKTNQGPGSCSETKSPGSSQSMQVQERGSQETLPTGSSSTKHPETSDHKRKETPATGIEDMPSVFTIGDGPNGRKVEGILYKYGKGEEVRIMCVCHGNFHSPAEFVKHAGGSDVDHPLRHIVVNPSSSPFP